MSAEPYDQLPALTPGEPATALTVSDDWEVDECRPTAADIAEGEEYERRTKAEKHALFKKLKYASQAIYGLTEGNPGLRRAEQWGELLEQAGDDLGNGHFLVRSLGAERYLEPATVAILLTLRQNLIAEVPSPTTSDIMLIDAAVLAYYNVIRVQGWIGNIALVIERELFGKDITSDFHCEATANKVEEQVRRLADVLLPLQDRANRMMVRNLAELRASTPRSRGGRSQ